VAEHPGQEYLDAAFGPRERERLEAVEEARRRPGSVWHESRLWDGAASTASSSSVPARAGEELDAKPVRERCPVLSVQPTCPCCRRAFAPVRRSAKFCGPVCRRHWHRGRCEQEVA
jgi:hypothetical protein